MNAVVAIVILFGCVGVSSSQTTCSIDSHVKWQKCVEDFNFGKNDVSGNMQVKCDAARSFLFCIKDLEGCSSQSDYNAATRSEAHRILTSWPCDDVMTSSASMHDVYLPALMIATLTFYFV